MTFEIWKKIKKQISGDRRGDWDGEWGITEELLIVMQDELDKFGEYMADEYGYQDYSYEVEFKKIGTFKDQEALQLLKLLEKVKNKLFLEDV